MLTQLLSHYQQCLRLCPCKTSPPVVSNAEVGVICVRDLTRYRLHRRSVRHLPTCGFVGRYRQLRPGLKIARCNFPTTPRRRRYSTSTGFNWRFDVDARTSNPCVGDTPYGRAEGLNAPFSLNYARVGKFRANLLASVGRDAAITHFAIRPRSLAGHRCLAIRHLTRWSARFFFSLRDGTYRVHNLLSSASPICKR